MAENKGVPPIVNQFMKLTLRSPLHGLLSKYILLISFKGRKSGKTYTTPVSYGLDGQMVTIFTHANWWKNLRGGAPVQLQLRGRAVTGTADVVVEDKDAIIAALSDHLRRSPFDARYYDVTMDENGSPNQAEVTRAVETVVLIRVALAENPSH